MGWFHVLRKEGALRCWQRVSAASGDLAVIGSPHRHVALSAGAVESPLVVSCVALVWLLCSLKFLCKVQGCEGRNPVLSPGSKELGREAGPAAMGLV